MGKGNFNCLCLNALVTDLPKTNMCGISGFLTAGRVASQQELYLRAKLMASTLHHRGPDAQHEWVSECGCCALAHNRLAIVELSPLGAQPMASPDTNWIISFNGEIYNHNSLRDTLVDRGIAFRGRSDTEVICAALQEWGLSQTLTRLEGMFAIAIWNRQERVLTLARDRLGEKPLYYAYHNQTLIFGSQLSALRKHPAFRQTIDESTLWLYAQHNYVPQPRSIFQDCRQLEPGTYATFTASGNSLQESRHKFWERSFRSSAAMSQSFEDYCDQAHNLLSKSVGRQMEADVSVGAFLSGGIDSSTVVALMQAQSTRAVRTFTIGFEHPEYDESSHAAHIAKALGTDHTSVTLSSADVAKVMPAIARAYDEPFADSSQIPTSLVARIARMTVTTALSGDGGDELLCGYTRYFLAARIGRQILSIPRPFRLAIRATLHPLIKALSSPPLGLRSLASSSKRRGSGALGRRAQRIQGLLKEHSFGSIYLSIIRQSAPFGPIFNCRNPTEDPLAIHNSESACPFDMMMQHDMDNYLLSDILVKVDRAAMAVSLETRVPMLDRAFVEFCRSLPLQAKFGAGIGKLVLRRVLSRYIPESLFDRPKMGFGVPLALWLRGPLRPWAESLVFSYTPSSDFIELPRLRQYWQRLIDGTDVSNQVWNALMFLSWEQNLKD